LIDGGGAWWAIYCSWAEPRQIFYRTSNFRLSWQAINKQASKQRGVLLACLLISKSGPTQPQFIPPNVMFEVDDLEETWTFNKSFDFIFARMTVGAFADSPRFFQQSFEHLVPGGWIECMDICNPIKADDSSMTSDTALLQWFVFCLLDKLSAN